jgi:hypothetical protein
MIFYFRTAKKNHMTRIKISAIMLKNTRSTYQKVLLVFKNRYKHLIYPQMF